jgi:predicted Rdx family selenoprotein
MHIATCCQPDHILKAAAMETKLQKNMQSTLIWVFLLTTLAIHTKITVYMNKVWKVDQSCWLIVRLLTFQFTNPKHLCLEEQEKDLRER